MKRILAIAFLFLNCSKLFSQHSSLTISNDFKIKDGTYEYDDQTMTHCIFHDNNFYTVTNSRPSGSKWLFTKLYDIQFTVTASVYDKEMKKIKAVDLDNGKKDFGPLMPSILTFNNKLYIAYFKGNDKSSFNLYLARIDENDLSLGEAKTVCTIQQENVGIGRLMSVIEAGLVYFAISPDNTRLLVSCKVGPGKIQDLVLDDKLNILKQSTATVSSDAFDIPSATLTNENGACLILHSKETYDIIGITPEGKKTESHYANIGNFSPINVNAQLARDGKSIIIYATAGQGDKPTTCDALIVSRMDAVSFKLSKPVTYELSPEFLQSVSEKGGGFKHKKDFFMYNFSPQLLEEENGDLVILGSPESYEAESNTFNNMDNKAQTIATTRLNVGPILAFFPDKNGKMRDQIIIPRKIVMTKAESSGAGAIRVVQSPRLSDASSGFIMTQKGDDIVIIYNDNTKNLSESVDEKVKTSKWASDLELAEAMINRERKLEYRKLIGESDQKRTTFFLRDVIPTTSSSYVFPIAKEGIVWNARKIIYTNWCFLDIK